MAKPETIAANNIAQMTLGCLLNTDRMPSFWFAFAIASPSSSSSFRVSFRKTALTMVAVAAAAANIIRPILTPCLMPIMSR